MFWFASMVALPLSSTASWLFVTAAVRTPRPVWATSSGCDTVVSDVTVIFRSPCETTTWSMRASEPATTVPVRSLTTTRARRSGSSVTLSRSTMRRGMVDW